MEGKLSHTTPAHVFAASPSIRRDLCDKLKVKRVEANWCEAEPEPFTPDPMPPPSPAPDPDYSLPLVEIDVAFSSGATVSSVLDSGSQIVVIREDLAQQVGAKINTHRIVEVEGANGGRCRTVGCAEHLPLQVGDALLKVHAHVISVTDIQSNAITQDQCLRCGPLGRQIGYRGYTSNDDITP
jgi:hypothetical protein